MLATVFGALYIVLGAVGFTATAGVGVVATTGGYLFGVFGVNVLQNLVHLVIGVALVACGLSRPRVAKAANSAAGTFFLVLGLVGLFVVGTDANVLALNGADNVLHFGSAIVLLAVGVGAEKPSTTGGNGGGKKSSGSAAA